MLRLNVMTAARGRPAEKRDDSGGVDIGEHLPALLGSWDSVLPLVGAPAPRDPTPARRETRTRNAAAGGSGPLRAPQALSEVQTHQPDTDTPKRPAARKAPVAQNCANFWSGPAGLTRPNPLSATISSTTTHHPQPHTDLGAGFNFFAFSRHTTKPPQWLPRQYVQHDTASLCCWPSLCACARARVTAAQRDHGVMQ